MAYVMTYSSLLEDMRNYLERGLSTDPQVYAQLPRLIAMAEKQIATELKPQGFERWVNAQFTAGNPVFTKPNRWRETISVTAGVGTGNNTRVTLFPRSYQTLVDYWPDRTQTAAWTADTPLYYADYDYKHFFFAPTPAAAYPWELGYWELLAPLDDTNQTNWLTQYAPQVILYQALLQATPFLKNDDRIGVWQAAYDRAAQAMLTMDVRKQADVSDSRSA